MNMQVGRVFDISPFMVWPGFLRQGDFFNSEVFMENDKEKKLIGDLYRGLVSDYCWQVQLKATNIVDDRLAVLIELGMPSDKEFMDATEALFFIAGLTSQMDKEPRAYTLEAIAENLSECVVELENK